MDVRLFALSLVGSFVCLDGQTEIPPLFYRTSSPLGSLPKRGWGKDGWAYGGSIGPRLLPTRCPKEKRRSKDVEIKKKKKEKEKARAREKNENKKT